MRRKTGHMLLYVSALITIILWLLSKQSVSFIFRDLIASLSQIFALLGLLFMMINITLSTRFRFLEDLWGGLDKVYESHHLIGIISFILLINHPLLMAMNALPDVSLVRQYLLLGTFLPYNLGILAQYFMLFAFIFILLVKIPYHLWKRTHQLMGFVGVLGGLHAMLITSDISVFIPLRIWMMFWIGMGMVSFLYTFFFYNTLGDIFVYEVKNIERTLDIVNITASPVRKKIIFRPGQFAYISFANKAVGSEQHPFSFSSAPQEENIRFSIKMMGDYTVKLPLLKKGDKMYLKGPYGKFGEAYLKGKKPLVWIIGGIGVTPFLSMLRHREKELEGRKILLYYCVSSREEGVFSDEINRLTSKNKTIEVYDWISSDRGRFSVARVLDVLGKYHDYDVQICGPGPMMESLKQQFKQIGINEERIIFERFEMI